MLDIGLIGAGGVARWGHVDAIQGVDGARLTDVADRNPEKAAEVAESADARAHDSHEGLLDAVDAVYVCTQPRERVEVIQDAAEAGLPIFTEKPIAGTVENGRRIVRAVESAEVPCMVGFSMRFRAPYRDLHRLVEEGEIGRPIHLFATRTGEAFGEAGENWRTTPEQVVGMTVESCSHELDLFRWLGGEIAAASGEAVGTLEALPEFDDSMGATLRFESGAIGTLAVSWRSTVGQNRRGVIGTEGTAVVEGPSMWTVDRLRVNADGDERVLEYGEAEDSMAAAFPAETEAFVSRLRADEPMPVTARDGLRTLEVAREIRESHTDDLQAWMQPPEPVAR